MKAIDTTIKKIADSERSSVLQGGNLFDIIVRSLESSYNIFPFHLTGILVKALTLHLHTYTLLQQMTVDSDYSVHSLLLGKKLYHLNKYFSLTNIKQKITVLFFRKKLKIWKINSCQNESGIIEKFFSRLI